jgi:hypothetical protein
MRAWLLSVPLGLSAGLVLACTSEDFEPTKPVAGDVSAAATTKFVVVDHAGDVGQFTSLVSSSGGRQHITYYDVTNTDLKYATCAATCTVAGNWTTGFVDRTGNVGFSSSLEVVSAGRRHVTYEDVSNFDLKYATCPAGSTCTAASDWVKTRVDSAGLVGSGSSLALGSDGSRQVSYLKTVIGGRTLKFASCVSSCGQAAGWTRVALEQFNTSVGYGGEVTSLVLGPDGRRHLSYFDPANGDLKYATCLSNCVNALNWQKLAIDQSGVVGLYNSLALGSDGVLHVSYYDLSHENLRYARCAFDCTTAANWKKVTLKSSGDVGGFTSLAAGSNGRVHLTYYYFNGTANFYLNCAADCTVLSNWSGTLLDGVLQDAGTYGSLALAGNQVHISYYDQTNGNLKYLEHTP